MTTRITLRAADKTIAVGMLELQPGVTVDNLMELETQLNQGAARVWIDLVDEVLQEELKEDADVSQ